MATPTPTAASSKPVPTSTPLKVKDLISLLGQVGTNIPILFNCAGVMCNASGIDVTTDGNGSPVVVITRDAGG